MNHKIRNISAIPALFISSIILVSLAHAGGITMSGSVNGTKTVDTPNRCILAQDTELVTLEAFCTNGNVAVTYTLPNPTHLVQKSDSNTTGKDEKTVFSIIIPDAVHVDNTISANVTHNAQNAAGAPCLPNGKKITFHVLVPKIVFNLTKWSTPNNTKVGAFTAQDYPGTSGNVAIGALVQNAAGKYTVPDEYIVTVAPDASVFTGFDPHQMGVDEQVIYNLTENPKVGNPIPIVNNVPDHNTYTDHDGSSFANVFGAANADPTFYACDAPGLDQSAADYLKSTDTSVVGTVALTSTPTYNGILVGQTTIKKTWTYTITWVNGQKHWDKSVN